MLLRMMAVTAISIGLATSAMAQSGGGSGGGSSGGASGSGSGTTSGTDASGSGNTNASGTGANTTIGAGATGANSSGGDPNDCQRQQAGGTGNPAPTSGNSSTQPDAANACQ